MPNLVGTGLNQVPTNSMLGGMAYQSPDHASIKSLDLKNLSQINSEIADTAVDVFVYDTSKDSDGGAWRKRTQNTSWYNETLNTATRGSRREFPAVAVLVLESTQLTIYDGDDPDLPMWMVFNRASNNMLFNGSSSGKKVEALNGHVALANSDALFACSFIDDRGYLVNSSNTYESGNILGRNSGYGYNITSTVNELVSSATNDVAMTVLPNAPIDSSTGLPIPTIAVGTNTGLSVIREDGNVYDVTYSAWNRINKVFFTEENLLAHLTANEVDQTYGFHYIKVPSGDFNNGSDGRNPGTYDVRFYNSDGRDTIPSLGAKAYAHSFIDGAIGYSGACPSCGLVLLEKDAPEDYENSSIAFVSTNYNTGWMHGDIKGAFLSDTDTTNVTGSEKISNHDFSADFSTQWEAQNSANTSYDATNDRVTVTSTQNYSGIKLKGASLPTLTQGKRYIMTVDVHSITNPIRFGVVSGGTKDSVNSPGVHTLVFTAGANISEVFVQKPSGSNSTFILNSVSIREAEEDRSVNDKGLQVYGTITKSLVETGADLVAYSGFSSSNYLKQPHNSELAPGTAAYSVSCWFKTGTSSGDQYIFDRSGTGTGSRNLLLIMQSGAGGGSDSKFQWWHRDANGNVTDIQITDKTITDNAWHQVVALNDGTNYMVYVDGKVSSITSSVLRNVGNDQSPPMFVGVRHTGGSTFMTGSMALFRYSCSAPSAEQIKKIYEDEKCLFRENAKATLYGSSDAVTALEFDEVTDLLHVGTSSGRSDFSSLKRVDHSTTAVTTAISAHDGLIAQQ